MPMVEQYVVVCNGEVFDKNDDLQEAITTAMYAVDDVSEDYKLVAIWDQLSSRIVAVITIDNDGYHCRELGKEIEQAYDPSYPEGEGGDVY